MVRLKASSEITKHCQKRELDDWQEQNDAHQLSAAWWSLPRPCETPEVMLTKSGTPPDLPEQLWHSQDAVALVI